MAKYYLMFHKLKSIVGYSIAIVVIVTALGVSGLRFLLTTANLYQNEVEQLASELLKQPVKIGRMDARISGVVPTLIFHDVQLLSEKTKKPLLYLSRIDVGLLFEDLLWHQKITPAQVTIRGMDLHVTRTVEGKFKIKGIDLEGLTASANGDKKSNSIFESWLLQQGEVGVEDSTFTWKDEKNAGLTWVFPEVNFLLKNSSERQQLLLSGKLPKILGEKIKLAIDLQGDITSSASWKVKIFIESKDFNLKPIQKYIKNTDLKLIDGIADLKLWVDWENKNIKQLSGDMKLRDFSYQISKKDVVTLKLVSGIFDSHRDENNTWDISVDKFNYKNNKEVLTNSTFSLSFNYNNERIDTFYLQTNHLKFESLSKIMFDNHLLNRKNEKLINNLNVQGDIRDFYIAWKDNEIRKLMANFSNFGMNAWQEIPKLQSLSGSVAYEQQEGVISLSSKNAVVGFPGLFRQDFNLDQLQADIAFLNTKQGMLFDIKHLIAKNIEVNTISTAKLWLPKDNASPYLDLQTHVTEGDVSKVSHFLPVTIMDGSLVDWLDQSLLEGKVEKSTIIFNGKLNDFPFDKKEGVFSVDVETSDFVLDYINNWPKIKKAKLIGNFTGQGMKLHLLTGEVENSLIYDSRAEISFFDAELQLDLSASGSTHNTMQYLINSSILSDAKKTVNSMRWLGNIATKIKVNIPLDDNAGKKKILSYSGSAELQDVSLFMLEDKLNITKGSGKLFFTEKGLSSKNLLGNILGEKAVFSVTSSEKNKKTEIAMKGKIDSGKILKRFDIPGAKNISGKTSFLATMTFPDGSLKNTDPVLKLKSNLLGVKSTLPGGFYKAKDIPQKFIFSTIFTGNDRVQFGVEFDDKASAILELDQSKKTYLRRGAISVSSKKAILPHKNILYIDGSINKITPSKWFKILELGKSKKVQTFFVTPIVLNLDELRILTDDEKSKNQKALNPKNLPEFEGVIKKLYLDNLFLGRLDFKASKKKYGLHFDELILSARHMKLFSHGDWRYKRGVHKTDMNITLSSNNFGGMLTDLDFSAIVASGTAQAVGKLNWQDAPTKFSFDKLNGEIQLNIEKGNIIEVDAGVGRLLGLFSLTALPRRLFGDFKDTFKSGFTFDTAKGVVKIQNGNAYMDDFKISSVVADIMVGGRTGLAERDYENTVVVIPGVGEGVAGVTALLVSLPAGVGVWLLNKITGEKFDQVSSSVYKITGSWDKPVIEQVEGEEEADGEEEDTDEE